MLQNIWPQLLSRNTLLIFFFSTSHYDLNPGLLIITSAIDNSLTCCSPLLLDSCCLGLSELLLIEWTYFSLDVQLDCVCGWGAGTISSNSGLQMAAQWVTSNLTMSIFIHKLWVHPNSERQRPRAPIFDPRSTEIQLHSWEVVFLKFFFHSYLILLVEIDKKHRKRDKEPMQ